MCLDLTVQLITLVKHPTFFFPLVKQQCLRLVETLIPRFDLPNLILDLTQLRVKCGNILFKIDIILLYIIL